MANGNGRNTDPQDRQSILAPPPGQKNGALAPPDEDILAPPPDNPLLAPPPGQEEEDQDRFRPFKDTETEPTDEDFEFEETFRVQLIQKLRENERQLRQKVKDQTPTEVKVNPRTGIRYEVEGDLPEKAQKIEQQANELLKRRMSLTQELEDLYADQTSFTERAGAQFQKSLLSMKNIVNNIANYDNARILEQFRKIDSGEIDPIFIPDGRVARYAEADEETRQEMKVAMLDRISDNASAIVENQAKSSELYQNPMTKGMVEAESFDEGLQFFVNNPIDAITGLSAASSLQMVPGMALGALGAATGGTALAFAGFAVGSGSVEFGAAIGDQVLERANEDEDVNSNVNEILAKRGVISEGQDGMRRFSNLKEYQEDIVSALPNMPSDTKEQVFDYLRDEGFVLSETIDGQQIERFDGDPLDLLRAIGQNPNARAWMAQNLPAEKYPGFNVGDIEGNVERFEKLSKEIVSILEDPNTLLHNKVMNVVQDPDAMEEIGNYAATRAGAIGIAEGLSAVIPANQVAKQIGKKRLAARMLGKSTKLSKADKARVAAGITAASTADAAGGAAGEAAAQLATGEDINVGELFAEGVPELIGAPVEITSTALGLSRNNLTPAEQEMLDEVRQQRRRLNVPFRSEAQDVVQARRRAERADQLAEEAVEDQRRRIEEEELQPVEEQEAEVTEEEVAEEVTEEVEEESVEIPEEPEQLQVEFEDESAAETQETEEGQPGIQTPPEQQRGEPLFREGLAVAARNPDGTVFLGKGAHATLINEFPNAIDIGQAEMGFFTQDGRFLSREQASEFLDENKPAEQQTPQEDLQAEQEEVVEEAQEAIEEDATTLTPASSASEQDIQTMRDAGLPDAAIEQFTAPDILLTEDGSTPQSGQPITVNAYRGIGREAVGDVYAEGAEGALLGDARYYAIDQQTAERFGDEVTESRVTLQNPLVITSDRDLARWMMGDENASIPSTNEERSARIQEFRERVEEAGYDGVVVNIPKSADVNQEGQSAKRLREVFGDTQIVDLRERQTRLPGRRPGQLRSTTLFSEELATEAEQNLETEVMDGQYRVRYRDGTVEVVNPETNETVSRQSNNWNAAITEWLIAQSNERGEFVNEEGVNTVEQYIQAVIQTSQNPLEIAQAYALARTIIQTEQESVSSDPLQVYFDGGGKIRPQDFEEFDDLGKVSEYPSLRFYTRKDATPLDIQSDILSRQAGREVSEREIVEFLFEYIEQTQQGNIAEQLQDRFEQLTGQRLTDNLADEIESISTEQFTTNEGAIIPQVDSLIEKYVNREGMIDFDRLWDEALSEDQQKGFFTEFPGTLTEQEYQQLKEEVQNAIETTTEQEEEASSIEPVDEPSQEQEQQEAEEPTEERSFLEAPPTGQEYGLENKWVSRERAKQARDELRRGLGGQFNAGIDPTLIKQMLELALFHIEAGSRKFGEFANAMIAEVGEKIKPYLRAIYKQAKYRSNLPEEVFSEDAEILAWEEENLSDNELINSVNREFREQVARTQAQGYKDAGRPELANPVSEERSREAVDYVDEQRKQQGVPSRQSDRVVMAEAKRRLEEDYEGEKARLFNSLDDFDAGLWSAVDVQMAKLILGRESNAALKSNNKADLFNFFLITGMYRQVGTEQARAFRMRRDDTKSPKERKAEMLKEVFEDTKDSVGLIAAIHDLTEQARRGEITKEEFREAVRELLNEGKSQREESSIQTWIEEVTGRRPKDEDIDDIFDAAEDGAEAVQETINEKAGKMSLPKMSIGAIMRLEMLIENVENAPPGRRRNQALLDLLTFVEESGILGGRFSRGLKAAIDDILNRDHEMFDETQDILQRVRNRVMENLTQAMLTPPKSVRKAMDAAETKEERQEIFDEYWERFQAIKAALKNEDGIDIENLTESDIKDAVLMNTILRKFQAANASFDDKLFEFWNNGILSAITTHSVNIAGTSANLFYMSVPLRLAEAFVNTFARDPNSAQWGELKYFYKGLFTHLPEAIKYAALSFQTESRLFAEEIGAEKGIGKFQDDFEKGVAIKGKLGRLVRAMGWRVLTMMDEFHKVMAFRAQVAAEAFREARRQGLEGEQITKFIEEQQLNPSGRVSEAAWGWALEVAFQEDPGFITQKFVEIRESHELVKYALPFVRTPGNLLKQGTRRGALGALNIVHRTAMAGAYKLGLNADSKWEYSRTEVTQHMAEQFVFWVGIGGLGMLFSSEDEDDPRPIVTGSGTSFRKQSAYQFEQQNYPPQSIRLPGTDRYFSYRRFDPFATTLTNFVDLKDAVAEAQSGRDILDVTNDYFEKNLRNLSDKSYFQWVGDMMRFVEYPASGLNWVGNFTASFMPNIIRHNARAGDDYVREYTKGDDTGSIEAVTKSLLKETAQRMYPVPSAQPPPRVDWLGDPVRKDEFGGATQTYLYRMLVPSITVDNPPTEYDELVMNWNNQNPNERWYPTVPADSFTINGKKVELNREEYFDYVLRRGFHTRRLLDEQYYKFDIWFPKQSDIDAFKNAQDKAGRIAKEEMINEGIVVEPFDEF